MSFAASICIVILLSSVIILLIYGKTDRTSKDKRKITTAYGTQFFVLFSGFTTQIAATLSLCFGMGIALPVPLMIFGVAILVAAIFFLVISKSTLGNSYSPCINSYAPDSLVIDGVYQYIRHPIYTANILYHVGCMLASGSPWIAINVAILFVVYGKNAELEEAVLTDSFPEHKEYINSTGRFLPKVF